MNMDELRKYHQDKEYLMRNEGTHPANEKAIRSEEMMEPPSSENDAYGEMMKTYRR